MAANAKKVRSPIKSPWASRRDRAAEREEKCEAVLQAAAQAFAENGYYKTSLDSIAARLGVTKPTLYYYARSKDQLLAECAKIALGMLRDAVSNANDQVSGRDRLTTFFRQYAEIICDDFGRCFVLTDRRELNEPEKEIDRANQRELSDVVQAMIGAGIKDGSLRRSNPIEVCRALFAVFNGTVRWYRTDTARRPSQIADDLLAILFEGVGA